MLFDVAIVGYGPVGAVLACLLARRGLSVGVFEREARGSLLPRAVHFDGEVMRVFQAAGVAGEMAKATRASTRGMHFLNAAGRTLMIRQGIEGVGPQGWHNNHYFHQPDLERVLRAGAESHSNVHVRYDTEVTTLEDVGSHVRLNGSFEARYVVGCDGGRSLVRRFVGSGREDLGLHQPWLVADFVLKRDGEKLRQLPDYTIQYCDPSRPMTYCCVTGRRRRWETMLMPGDDPAEVVKPANTWRLVERWITPEDAELERSAVYTFHSVIADGWRRGRVLIAGDAAHQSPPFLGQGMCAGVRDAANLAWKLDAVVKRLANDSLLDTYESERRPHVAAFIGLSVKLGAMIQADGAAAEARDRQFAEGGPQLFHFPQPQLGPGVREDAPPPTGVIFPQPRLSDGRLLDDAIGDGFAVLALPGVHEGALSDPAIDAWLREHGAVGVVLRPDRYVFGVAADADALAALAVRARA